MKMTSLFTKLGTLFVIFTLLAACQTQGLSRKQIKTLQHQGFVLTDEGWALGLPERLLFASNESTLNETTKENILTMGKQLERVNILDLTVNGHTDNTGAKSYNLELSKKRADSVAEPLIDAGIPATRIQTKGLADNQPMTSNDTAEGRASNRRVTIIVAP